MLVKNDGIRMRNLLEQALFRWPILLGLGLLGALVGFFFSLMRPPFYQAEAVLGVNINYTVTEPLELVVEDRAINRVAAIIESDSTLVRVLSQLPESLRLERVWSEPADLRESLRLDRRLAEWDLVAIDRDPEVAVILAKAWADEAISVLDETAEHAWRAVALMGNDPFMVDCVPVPGSENSPAWVIGECAVEPWDLDPQALAGELRAEISLSRGMLPNFSYELLKEATLPTEPVIWSRGPLILSGVLIGLIFGFWRVVFRRN